MTTPTKPTRNSYFTSPRTGQYYWIDERGIAQLVPDEPLGCECEQDWRCPLHVGQPTWIETRYESEDDERERALEAADEARRNRNACEGGRCTTIDQLCSKHQGEYQARYGRASNE